MNADEYQKLAERTENTPLFIDHQRRKLREHGLDPYVAEAEFRAAENEDMVLSRLMHAVMGMITELGEFVDPLKRHLIYSAALDRTNLGEELGDESWYVAEACNALGARLSAIFERNIEKLRVRFPAKFTEDKALNRDLDAERKALEDSNPSIDTFDHRDEDHALVVLRRVAHAHGVDSPRKLRDSSNRRIGELIVKGVSTLNHELRAARSELEELRERIRQFAASNG